MLKNVRKLGRVFNLKGLIGVHSGNVPFHLYTAYSTCPFPSLGATHLCSSLFPFVLLLP
jgi:hypothetical protein